MPRPMLGRDGVGVEDHEVGGHALADQAAVGEAPVAGGHERQHAHRLLEGERLLGAHPVAQQVGLERRVHQLGDVGARVGQAEEDGPSAESATGLNEPGTIDMKLEVVTLPVSDVDRAKEFYASMGWRLDVDLDGGD